MDSAGGSALAGGATLVNVVATIPSGQQNAAGVTVLRDLDPPQVVIHDPVDGSVVFAPSVQVSGLVNDVVVGTVNVQLPPIRPTV